MENYKVVKHFTDLQDNGYVYHTGDSFPREGLEVSDKRIDELSTSKNRRGMVLIEKIVDNTLNTITEEKKVETEGIKKEKSPTFKPRKREKVNKNAE